MSSILSNHEACQNSAVQQLVSSNWDGQRIGDAVKILSVLEKFDLASYCQNGCKAVKKSYNAIVLNAHPDKQPCSNFPENGDQMAHRAFIMATDAKETLCEQSAMLQVCNPSRQKDFLGSLEKNGFESAFINIELVAEAFGIDLQAEGIDMWGKDRKKEPIDLASFDGFGSAPLKLTYKQAFEFVINKLERTPRGQPCIFLGMGVNEREDAIFASLTNIEHQNPPIPGMDRSNKGYVSWFDMISHALESVGFARFENRGLNHFAYRL